MGLRVALLNDDWQSFVESYDRVLNTSDTVFNVSVTKEERERDLDNMQ